MCEIKDNLVTQRVTKFNHCSELDCQANDGKGSCRINTCALIDPEKATKELEALNE